MHFRTFKTVTMLLLCASVLTGCGGGEDADDLADAGIEAAHEFEFPHRGPEWLAAPANEIVPGQS